MQIVFTDGSARAELDIVVHDPDATVGHLVRALGPADPTGLVLVVDGTTVPSDRRLDRSGITEGATVRLVPLYDAPAAPASGPDGEVPPPGNGAAPALPDAMADDAMAITVVGGLDAGGRTIVGPGTWPVGRDVRGVTLSSPTVSSRHATLDLARDGSATVRDEGSFNGTWVAGRPVLEPTAVRPGAVVRIGAAQLSLQAPIEDDRPVGMAGVRAFGAGTVPFNRPPRPAPPEPPEAIDPPKPPETSSAPSPVGVVSVLAPIVFGIIMIKAFDSLLFGLFALLSPVMLIGTAIESKRRGKKGTRKERQRFDRELDELRRTLADLAGRERERLAEELPDPAEVLRRAMLPSTRLWERRPQHPDSLHLRVGIGPAPWTPPVTGERRTMHDEVRAVVREAGAVADAPVLVDLSGGGVVGLVGDRAACLAVARSLVVQAATHHGPADLPLAVLVAADHEADWDWAKWLPHTLDPGGSGHRMLAADPEVADAPLRGMLERGAAEERRSFAAIGGEEEAGPATLVVLDDESLTEGRRSPARSVLRGSAGRVAGVVLAATADRLPAVCTTVVELFDGDGSARVHRVQRGEQVDDVLACGMSDPTARTAARALARFEDPELDVAGAGLPAAVGLLPLLGLDPPAPEVIDERWRAGGVDPDLVAPIGVAEDGVLALDLVRDGPHGLVAGTTGAGKSELLRSLVAGLGAGCSPDHLTFVLVDFKGGSAFDQCARLPHTVGMVTDLDAHLAERALRCLEAELRHRERALRDAGVGDLKEYRRLPGEREPMPRLMVVIDEFATLKAELPDFVESLVGVAQRGRSLGVHMVLATQRPSGAVNDNIRANTNLRIALRVQDSGDSNDVIDVPDAARIGRNQPGRALVRLGPGEVVPLQTALSTGVAAAGGHGTVEIRPFRFGPQPAAVSKAADRSGQAGQAGPQAATDLQRLVDATVEAHARSGRPAPRRPWPDPLPPEVDLDALVAAAGSAAPFGAPGAVVAFALADDPEAQAQYPVGWVPADGNLLLAGIGGSGTTTACTSLALAMAAQSSPDELHLYAMDFGAGELSPLAALPHVGAVVAAGERERQVRLVRWLRGELDRRRSLPSARTSEPRVVLLLDGISGFRSEWDDALNGVPEDLQRVFADGPEVGLHMVVTTDRTGAVPPPIQSLVRQRWLFRMGDPLDFTSIGIRATDVPDFHPGGAIVAEHKQEVQVARPADGLEVAVRRVAAAATSPPTRPPAPVGELPTSVDPAVLVPLARLDGAPWFVPLGISDRTLAPAGLVLYDAEHALVAGPARSGRSTALVTAATVTRAAAPDVHVVAVASGRSPLVGCEAVQRVLDPTDLRDPLAEVGTRPGPVLLLVDDADLIGDEDGSLAALLERRRPDLHVVAAGRNEALRSLYTHWTRTVRQSRAALLLRPDVDLDGDLAGITLPRRSIVALTTGRGYLVGGGEVEVIQVAGG